MGVKCETSKIKFRDWDFWVVWTDQGKKNSSQNIKDFPNFLFLSFKYLTIFENKILLVFLNNG